MSDLALAKVTRKGQMTIPQSLRKALGIELGDYLVLRPLMGGIFISKASVAAEVKAEDVLRQVAISLGQAAEEHNIREDEDLDTLVERVQEQAYRARYGS